MLPKGSLAAMHKIYGKPYFKNTRGILRAIDGAPSSIVGGTINTGATGVVWTGGIGGGSTISANSGLNLGWVFLLRSVTQLVGSPTKVHVAGVKP